MATTSLILMILAVSCNEDSFLEEKPLSIYSLENSLVTSTDYQSAINRMYYNVRNMVFGTADGTNADSWGCYWAGTDFAFVSCDETKFNTWAATVVPTHQAPRDLYKMPFLNVTQANLVLSRIEKSSLSDADKRQFRGEALFFRGYAYKMLANLFGGVPLIVEEITSPRQDFVRSSRDETYTQAKNDLDEAASLLTNIDQVKDGKISKQLAQHYLAEVYISLGDYDKAIATATAVIDYSGIQLMTTRFGSKVNEPGDAYSDLYQPNNQNRASGNLEALWVLQYEYKNAGTFNDSFFNYFNPFYSNITLTVDGVTVPAFLGNTAEKGGRSTGWAQPTKWFYDQLWEEGDQRNSEYMIVRDVQIDNPASPAFGKWFVADGYCKQSNLYRQWFPFIRKIAGDVPSDYYQLNDNGSPKLTPLGEHLVNNINASFKDFYLVRLADTYLLRAEAYFGKNNQAAAAADINIIRARVQAPLANAADIDIDYILDERMRELYLEEIRLCTLMRLGKFVDRVRRYNAIYDGPGGAPRESSGTSVQEYHNLLPIPFDEIERNVLAKLEQNPGYK
ncbi:MAG: RagB/SusD family nutrient uptake outer membrane protein [Tannerella sp.]|nr:RagB/SusD family nutrient uptake outer membrane protein [Tannerella sp.]